VALALASRCYVLDQGRIHFEGSGEALRRDHAIQARFLGAT
jgi:ABC-type branched-subunit amino acid transport system ATPase component